VGGGVGLWGVVRVVVGWELGAERGRWWGDGQVGVKWLIRGWADGLVEVVAGEVLLEMRMEAQGCGAVVGYLLMVHPWAPGLTSGLVVHGQAQAQKAQGRWWFLLRLLAGHLFPKLVLVRVDAPAGFLAVTMLVLYPGSASHQPANPPCDSSSPAHAVLALLASQPGAVSTRQGSATFPSRWLALPLEPGLEAL